MKKRSKAVKSKSISKIKAKAKFKVKLLPKIKSKVKSKSQSKPKLKLKVHKQAKKLVKTKPVKKVAVKVFKTNSSKSKSSKSTKVSALDMSKIKADIEQQLKTGKIEPTQAQILEQRAPIEHAVKNVNKHVNKNVKKGKLGKNKTSEKIFTTKERKPDHIGKVTEYIKTGIPGFDDLFEHGIPKGNAVIVAGGAGSGKTILCLQTIFHHISNGKKCFYMSFEESEEKLIQHMNDFGWDVVPFIKSGKLVIKRLSPFEISRSVEAMLAKEKGELLIEVDPILIPKGFKPEIIALDSLTAIASAFTGKEDSYRIYIEQLFRFFEKLGSTSFLITETKQIPDIFSTTGVEEFLADGVIVLYAIKRGNIRENAVEVLKMRGEKHQKKIVAMQISNKGITVFPEQEVFGGLGESQ